MIKIIPLSNILDQVAVKMLSAQNDNVLFAQSRNVLCTTSRQRDRLVALKKAKKKMIMQKQAAQNLESPKGACGVCCEG